MRPGKEPPERLEGTAPAAFTEPGVVSAPPSQTATLPNAWGIRGDLPPSRGKITLTLSAPLILQDPKESKPRQ